MSPRSLLCLTLVTTLALAGCTAGHEPPPAPTPLPAGGMRLVAFDSCAQLRSDLRAAAQRSVGPWGLPGANHAEAAVSRGGARTAVDSARAAPAAAFSRTNAHEAGADEPDLVKTDGRRIVTVHRGVLRVVDPARRVETGRLDLGTDEHGPANLLLSGDRALVLVDGWQVDRGDGPGARMLLVDLTGAPRLVSSYRIDGSTVDARQTGSVARVVVRTAPRIAFPESPRITDESRRTEANREVLAKAEAQAWLPSWSVTTGATGERGTVGCDRVSRPSDYSAASMLTVLTFDLAADGLRDGRPVSLVADGDTVYGTGNALYVANDQRWRLDRWPGRDNRTVAPRTEIFRFTLDAAQPPAYAAAGTVRGWLVNQYALSEWEGHLRVATTDDDASAVRVLAQRGDELRQVGEIDGLGRGERIYSVRFLGDRAYVVTFKQTDPLYSLDLSDPARPRVTGELKITGYSAHLQPAGAGRLIGIGQEASTEGRVQGTQISLFDVSDPAAPRRLARHHVPYGSSEAEFDPHALLWWPATGLLVLPMASHQRGPTGGTALALRVTDETVRPVADITQRGAGDPAIRRSLVVGDTLWTLSDAGLQAADLSTLDTTAFVRFG